MMIAVLAVIFVVLALFIGGDRTAKSIVTLMASAVILFCSIGAMYMGAQPLAAAAVTCVLVTLVTVFFQNEINEKSKAAFISVMIVIGIMTLLILLFVYEGHLQGVPVTGQYHIRESNGYSGKISIGMYMVQAAVMLMTIVGAVIDVAIAVTSGAYEVSVNDPQAGFRDLLYSGIKIGRDILSSTVNTLFFIFAGEYLLMFVNFLTYYSVSDMINSKEFAQGSITILISAAGCLIVIPVAAAFAAARFTGCSRVSGLDKGRRSADRK